jgi:hypothetical protein
MVLRNPKDSSTPFLFVRTRDFIAYLFSWTWVIVFFHVYKFYNKIKFDHMRYSE